MVPMLKKLCALVLLALALSPFTAPFSTFDSPKTSSPVLIHEHNPGSVIAPLITETGRLKIAPIVGTLVISYFLADPRIISSAQLISPAVPVSRRSTLSAILRV
jgi:hypothetical protein